MKQIIIISFAAGSFVIGSISGWIGLPASFAGLGIAVLLPGLWLSLQSMKRISRERTW